MKTQAQKFSELFDDDGQVFETEDDRELRDAARKLGAREERDFDKTRYTFSDGSVVTELAGGWDFGYADCWCWQGAGHNDDCPESPNYEQQTADEAWLAGR